MNAPHRKSTLPESTAHALRVVPVTTEQGSAILSIRTLTEQERQSIRKLVPHMDIIEPGHPEFHPFHSLNAEELARMTMIHYHGHDDIVPQEESHA